MGEEDVPSQRKGWVMNWIIIGNVVLSVASILMCIGGACKTKKNILTIQTTEVSLMAIGNLMLGSIPGAIAEIINITRNLLCYKNKLNVTVKIALMIISIVLGLLLNNIGLIGVLPIISTVAYILVINSKDVLAYKMVAVTSLCLWFVHDLYIGAYITACFDIAAIMATTYSILAIKIQLSKQTMIQI